MRMYDHANQLVRLMDFGEILRFAQDDKCIHLLG